MTIGIIMRPSYSSSGHKIWVLYNDFVRQLKKFQVNILPINQNDYETIIEDINHCNGVILQGGDVTTSCDAEIISYLYKNDIPTLGICLGMQEMGKILGGKLISCSNHLSHNDYVHFVNIKPNSYLYDIVKASKILVNSRHKFSLDIDASYISAEADGIVEAIEDRNKKYFIGLQWHPESLCDDEYTKKIFTSFIEMCKNS